MDRDTMTTLMANYPRFSFDFMEVENGIIEVADVFNNRTITITVKSAVIGYNATVQIVQGNKGWGEKDITTQKSYHLTRWGVLSTLDTI